ncbi:MAG: hypothetical protein HYU02_02335 [Thaumarchaeota archaeon]|nr:hypothetical protein [Nitrososphaerota archaeon]
MHAIDAWEKKSRLPEFDVDEVIFAGMGASGIIGEVISDWLYDASSYSFKTIHQPTLPSRKDSRALLFAISASGNTWEVMSAVRRAVDLKWKIITMSEGGALEQFSRVNGIPHIRVKKFEVPRASFPYLLYSAIRALHDTRIVEFLAEVEESIETLVRLQSTLSAKKPFDQNASKKLALWLHGGIPIIYVPYYSQSVGRRFKNGINENAKTHAFVNSLPEVCHNEVMAWECNSAHQFRPILIRDKNDEQKISERFDGLGDILNKSRYAHSELWTNSESRLSTLTSEIYALDLSSIYLAIANGTDPRPTHTIDELKSRFQDSQAELVPTLL